MEVVSARVERYMDLLTARQKLVATNIANADTPGYKTQDLDFQHEFETVASGLPTLVHPQGLQTKNDGNDVSLDRESRLLAENAIRFAIATQLLKGQMHEIREAITEGKGS
jgi:flagellar basal-body rod protein FlgB